MIHRFSTWWRALSVVLLSLATVTWPSAARAGTTPPFTVVHQNAVAALSPAGTSRFYITLKLSAPDPSAVAQLSLYPRIVTRSQIAPIISGTGLSSAAVATTGNFALNCQTRGLMTFAVNLYTVKPGRLVSPCGAHAPLIRLPCASTGCDGVYPLSYSVTSDGTTATKWSLIAVQVAAITRPLHLNWIETLDSSSLPRSGRTLAVLNTVAQHPAEPFSLSTGYRTLNEARQTTTSEGPAWIKALDKALVSPLHRVILSPPSNIDFSGLVANGLGTQVTEQFALGRRLLRAATGHDVDTPVMLTGKPSLASLYALAGAGFNDVVVPESALSVAPSSTLNWGAPFHIEGAASLSALSVDEPLSQLATDSAIEPGRRAAMTLATLAFLHYEAPYASASRSVVMVTSTRRTPASFVNDLMNGLTRNPFVTAGELDASFSPSLVGTNGAPVLRTILASAPSTWSAHNTASLTTLIGAVTSYNEAITSSDVSSALSVAVAQSEILGSPDTRQAAVNSAANALSVELSKFSVDPSTITLAGPGTALPITLLSRADYTVTAVVHLITDRLSFPKGNNIVTTMNSPTTSLRIPTSDHRGSSLTLQVLMTTPNNQVVLARAAIQVRIAGTSVVGYLLTLASLLVLAVWWWRTYRRRSKGRHAR